MTPARSYQHDLFVSYARVDDDPFPGESEGWVTTLVKALRTMLAQKLGRQEFFSVWTDHQLGFNARLEPEIFNTLRNSAAILVVLSPGYLESKWCLREKETFLEAVQSQADKDGRIFVIERDRIENVPPDLAGFLRCRFWEEDEPGRATHILGYPKVNSDREPRYFQLVNNLAFDLERAIRRLQGLPKPLAAAATPARRQATLFLAEVTDDLDPLRDDLKTYLTQAGLPVLPESLYPSFEPAAFRQKAEADLARSEVFVQLLSEVAGKSPPDLPQGYVGLQYELARARGCRILQWRRRDLALAAVGNPRHRALLEGETVAAEGLEDFKARVVRVASAPPGPPPPPRVKVDRDYFVFINAEERDLPLAREVGTLFERQRIGYATPLRSGEPSEIREDLERNLLYCDALMVFYGQTRSNWVRAQLLESRKIMYQREAALHVVAVYEGPPEEKPDRLDIHLPNLQVINCRRGFNEGSLGRFLNILKGVNG